MIQIFRLLCLCFWMLLLPTGLLCAEGGDDVLARMIHLSKEKNTVYRLLDKVSEQTGFLFIYDSKLIDNEKTVRIPKGDYTIRQAIYLITGNKELSLRVIGDHILISGPQPARQTAIPETIPPKEADNYFIVKGILHAARLASPVYALLLPLRLRTPQDRGLSSRRTTHGDHARCQNNPDPRSRSAHRQPTPPASRHERKHPEKLPAITRLPDYFLPGRNRTKK